MKRFIKFLSPFLVAVMLTVGLFGCSDGRQTDAGSEENGVKVTLDSTSLVLKTGEERKLNATVTAEDGEYECVWISDDRSVADVSSDGTVTALGRGSAVVSVTAGKSSDYCQVTVTEQGEVSVDDENKVAGYVYYEDFEERDGVPGYLRQSVSGGGAAEVSDGQLMLSTSGAGMAFVSYAFDDTLSGKIVAETRVKVGSTAFSNILFFYRGEAGYDNNDIIACLGMGAGGFKNHDGSGWSASIAKYSVNTWYDIKMVLDIGAGKYSLYINGTQYADQTFRKRGDGVEDRIKLLKFGTDKSNAQLTYDYIKISGDYSPTIAATETTYSLALDNSDSVTLKYNVSGTPKPSVSVTSDCQYATVAGDNKTITFSEGVSDGTYTFTVRAENQNGYNEKQFTVIVRGNSAILLDTQFDSVPGGMTFNSSNGSAAVSDGKLILSTQSATGVLTYAKYDFGENLSGKVEAETQIKINSSAFLNVLFLFRSGTTSLDASRCTSSLAIEKNQLKYHNGSGWATITAAGTITNNSAYLIKVVYDFDNYTMSVWLNEELVLDEGRMRQSVNDTAVLIMGSDKVNSYIEYEYLKFNKVVAEDNQ